MPIYYEACNCLFEEEQISRSFYEIIKKISIPNSRYFQYHYFEETNESDFIEDIGTIRLSKCDYKTYICCFTLSENKKYMWNNYANGTGCCLELSGLYFVHPFQYSGTIENEDNLDLITPEKPFVFEVLKVLYSHEEKINYLKECILKYAYGPFLSNNTSQADIERVIERVLINLQYVFKEEKYGEEDEIRVVIYIPNSLPIGIPDNYSIVFPSENSRTTEGKEKFYIEINFEDTNFDLLSIFIQNGTDDKNKVLNYLKQCGFSNTAIVECDKT